MSPKSLKRSPSIESLTRTTKPKLNRSAPILQPFYEDDYPIWWTKERVLDIIYTLPHDPCYNAIFNIYILAIVLSSSCIQMDPPLPPRPADFRHVINIFLMEIMYIFHVFALFCNDYHRINLGESKSLFNYGYILDMISLLVPYITALVMGICKTSQLIDLAAIALRMYRPFKYLNSLNYYLKGSISGTLFKYLYISITFRILYSVIFMYSGQVKDYKYLDSEKWLQNIPKRLLFRSFYLVSKIFVPLGTDQIPNEFTRHMYVIAMFSGVLLVFGIATASLSLIIGLYMLPEEEFRSRFRLIIASMESSNLPPILHKKIETFYRMFWHKQKAVSETRLLPIYPPCLAVAIRTNIYFQAMQKSRIMRNLSSPFLSEISKHMETVHYIPGDFIIERNSSKSSVIFISHGDVELKSAEDDETALLRFMCGTILNSCGMCVEMACTRSNVAICAATFCTAHVLPAAKFWHVVNKYGRESQFFLIHVAMKQHLERVREHFATRIRPQEYIKYKSNIILLKRTLMELKEAQDDDGKLLLQRTDMFINIARCYFIRNQSDLSLTGEADEICLRPTFPCILQPNSSLLTAWNIFVAIITLIMVFAYPYYVVYVKDLPVGFKFFNYMVTLVNILDTIVHLSTGTKVEEGVALTFMQTSSVQMQSYWFIINVIAIIPIFEVTGLGFYAGLNKLVKIPQIFRMLKNFEDVCVYQSNFVRLFSFFLLSIILTYLVGALQQHFGCDRFGYCLVTNFTDSPYWSKEPLDNGPVAGRLIYSLYYAISLITLTTHKTSSLAKYLWHYQLFILILLEVCVIVHVMIEGTYSATIMVTESMRDRYETCIKSVKAFLVKMNVDPLLRTRFINYLQLCWYTDKAYAITHDKKSVFFDLPPHVNEDILTMQRSKYFLAIPFMKFLPNEVLKKISAQARLFHTAPHEILLNTGDINNEIYVIKEGVCEVLDPITKKVVRLLRTKSYFGDIECLLRLPAYYSVRAASNLRLYSISINNLEKCIEIPKIKDAINYAKELPEYAALLVAQESFVKYELPPKPPNREHFPLPRKYQSDYNFVNPFKNFGHLSVLRYIFPRFTLRPDGQYLRRYECFRAICALASANIFPFYSFLVLQFPCVFHLTLLLDFSAYCDVIQRTMVGYYNDKGLLIYHPTSTFLNYIKGAFIVDLIGCVPLEFLNYVRTTIYFKDNAYQYPSTSQILMYNRILQLYRVTQTIDILNECTDREDIILMFKAIPVFFALLVIVTSLMLECSLEKWRPVEGGWRLEIIRDPVHGSWIEKRGDAVRYNITATPCNAVLTAFYWVVYEITSTGFNIFQPNKLEMVAILTAGMLLGTVIITYYAVRVISIRSNVNQALGNFQEHMKDIITFMNREKFDSKFKREVVLHYKFQWDKMGGTDYRSILKLCDQITLRTDAILHIFGPTFTKCPILHNDISLLRCVGRAVESIYLRKHMPIVERYDVISEIYVVDRGTVEMHDYSSGKKVIYLVRGSVFGNLDNAKTVVCPVQFVTGTNVHLLQIKADKFHKIIEDFPAVRETMERYQIYHKNCILSERSQPHLLEFGSSRIEIEDIIPKKRFLKFVLKQRKALQIYLIVISVLCVYLDVYNAGFESNSIFLIIVLYILDICFYLTVILNVIRPYTAEKNTDTRKELLISRKEYHRSLFKYDLISCLPIEIFCVFTKSPSSAFTVLRLNRCFRLFTLHDSMTQYYKNLTINLTVATVASVSVWFFLFVHTAACIWHYLGVIYDSKTPFSSWRYISKNETVCKNQYTCSVYFILTTFTLTGIGDILPRQHMEVVFSCVLMILSTIILMIYVGEFSNIIQYRSFRYYSFYRKYLELLAFLKNNRVADNLITVTKNYTLHLWQEARGQQEPYFLKTAPKCLRLNIMSAAYMHHLIKHPVFTDCEPSFLRQLVGHFEFYHYSEDLHVVKEGQITDAMYFVHKGRVIEVQDDIEFKGKIYVAGEYFGTENALFRNVAYNLSYRTIIKSQVLTLCLDKWEYLLEHFPKSKDIIYSKKEHYRRFSHVNPHYFEDQNNEKTTTHHIFHKPIKPTGRNSKARGASVKLAYNNTKENTGMIVGEILEKSKPQATSIKTTSPENDASQWPMEMKRSTAAGSTVPGEIKDISSVPSEFNISLSPITLDNQEKSPPPLDTHHSTSIEANIDDATLTMQNNVFTIFDDTQSESLTAIREKQDLSQLGFTNISSSSIKIGNIEYSTPVTKTTKPNTVSETKFEDIQVTASIPNDSIKEKKIEPESPVVRSRTKEFSEIYPNNPSTSKIASQVSSDYEKFEHFLKKENPEDEHNSVKNSVNSAVSETNFQDIQVTASRPNDSNKEKKIESESPVVKSITKELSEIYPNIPTTSKIASQVSSESKKFEQFLENPENKQNSTQENIASKQSTSAKSMKKLPTFIPEIINRNKKRTELLSASSASSIHKSDLGTTLVTTSIESIIVKVSKPTVNFEKANSEEKYDNSEGVMERTIPVEEYLIETKKEDEHEEGKINSTTDVNKSKHGSNIDMKTSLKLDEIELANISKNGAQKSELFSNQNTEDSQPSADTHQKADDQNIVSTLSLFEATQGRNSIINITYKSKTAISDLVKKEESSEKVKEVIKIEKEAFSIQSTKHVEQSTASSTKFEDIEITSSIPNDITKAKTSNFSLESKKQDLRGIDPMNQTVPTTDEIEPISNQNELEKKSRYDGQTMIKTDTENVQSNEYLNQDIKDNSQSEGHDASKELPKIEQNKELQHHFSSSSKSSYYTAQSGSITTLVPIKNDNVIVAPKTLESNTTSGDLAKQISVEEHMMVKNEDNQVKDGIEEKNKTREQKIENSMSLTSVRENLTTEPQKLSEDDTSANASASSRNKSHDQKKSK